MIFPGFCGCLCHDDDFRDLEQPAKPEPRPVTRYEIEPYDPNDEEPDDDESELGHLLIEAGVDNVTIVRQ